MPSIIPRPAGLAEEEDEAEGDEVAISCLREKTHMHT